MQLGFGFGLPKYPIVNLVQSFVAVWILAAGIWNDAGAWDDTDVWNDA